MLPFSVLDKLLQDLEKSDCGKPTYDSYFVRTIHREKFVIARTRSPARETGALP